MMREMTGMEWILDIGLVILLAATLFHAVRLERALGVLKRDRTSLEALVQTFNASTLAAETGVERLRATTDGAGRQIQRQIDTAGRLKDDLTFLVQRGEGLADRLDETVRIVRDEAARFTRAGGMGRAARPDEILRATPFGEGPHATREASPHATRDELPRALRDELPRALRDELPRAARDELPRAARAMPPRPRPLADVAPPASVMTPALAYARAMEPDVRAETREEPRVRSQAERDLLKALRMAR